MHFFRMYYLYSHSRESKAAYLFDLLPIISLIRHAFETQPKMIMPHDVEPCTHKVH